MSLLFQFTGKIQAPPGCPQIRTKVASKFATVTVTMPADCRGEAERHLAAMHALYAAALQLARRVAVDRGEVFPVAEPCILAQNIGSDEVRVFPITAPLSPGLEAALHRFEAHPSPAGEVT